MKQEKKAELREKRAQKMRELRQQKKDDRMAAKAAILKEKAERKAARKAATEAKRLKVSLNGRIFIFRSDFILAPDKEMNCYLYY